MRAYSIFDDFPEADAAILEKCRIQTVIHPAGKKRPEGKELKLLLKEYDILIIGTGQKMDASFFSDITDQKIIATASIGTDHIQVPEEKKDLVKIINAPFANRISVAEHTFALILALSKHLIEGRDTAASGLPKSTMSAKPSDIMGAKLGVIGAGGTAGAVLGMAKAFQMKRSCWTRSPEKHGELAADGVEFVSLDQLVCDSDIISVNLPLTEDTEHLVSAALIHKMKENTILISLSRTEVIDIDALFQKAARFGGFRVGLDADADQLSGMWSKEWTNVIVTPHIGGGTSQSRIRMFHEVTESIYKFVMQEQ